jgi:hypothetical protein
MSVDVAEGAILVAGTESSYQGLYLCEAQGVTTLSISAAHATLGRRDLIVAKVQDAEYSGATNTFSLAVVTGTAAATPRYPTVPANATVLAVVAVAAAVTSIVNANITDIRSASASDGVTTLSNLGYASQRAVAVCTSATRPAGYKGLHILETDTGKEYIHDGANYQFQWGTGDGVRTAYTPTTAGIGTPTLACYYVTNGDLVTVRLQITLAGAGTAAAVAIGLPFTAHSTVLNSNGHGHAYFHDSSGSATSVGDIKIEAGGTTVTFWGGSSTGAPAADSVWFGSTTPVAMASGDVIYATFDYFKA